jgi:hypothetical protein
MARKFEPLTEERAAELWRNVYQNFRGQQGFFVLAMLRYHELNLRRKLKEAEGGTT